MAALEQIFKILEKYTTIAKNKQTRHGCFASLKKFNTLMKVCAYAIFEMNIKQLSWIFLLGSRLLNVVQLSSRPSTLFSIDRHYLISINALDQIYVVLRKLIELASEHSQSLSTKISKNNYRMDQKTFLDNGILRNFPAVPQLLRH